MNRRAEDLSDRLRVRRLIYLWSLVVAAPVMVIAAVLNVSDPALRLVYVMLATWLVPAFFAMLLYPRSVPFVERVTTVVIAVVWLLRMGLTLYLETDAVKAMEALSPTVTLGLVLVALMPQFTFRTRTAFVIGLVIMGLTSAMGIARFVGASDAAVFVAFLQHQFFLLVLVAFFFLLGLEKAALARVEVEQDRLRVEVYRDALTGLPNRRALDEAMTDALERANRTGESVAVIAFDLDHFKSLNDTHGHEAGDEALRRVGDVVRRSLREGDVLGRYGGEEFLIITPGVGCDVAARVAERCRAAIEGMDLGPFGSVTASFGVSQWNPGDVGSDVVRRADARLYRAKRAGRNRVDADSLDVRDG